MDPVSPKIPTKKRHSWIGSVKSRISPKKPHPGDENAKPRISPTKSISGDETSNLIGTSPAKSIRRLAHSIRLHLQQRSKDKQESAIERPKTTSPGKSFRINDKNISRRKSLSCLFSRTGVQKSKVTHEYPPPHYSSHESAAENMVECCFPPTIAGHVTGSCEKRNAYQSIYHSQEPITPSKTCVPEPATADEQSSHSETTKLHSSLEEIEAIVASMTGNHHFYPPKFWNTISIGGDLLRKPKPYKSLRDIPSKDDLRSPDFDGYLEETKSMRKTFFKDKIDSSDFVQYLEESKSLRDLNEEFCSSEFDRHAEDLEALRENASMYGLCVPDLDLYLGESIILRTPKHPRPSSQKLRQNPSAAVRIKYPGTTHMAIYPSREKAIADLYEKSSQLADYAIWDPVTRVIEAYPNVEKVLPVLSGEGEDARKYIWLPNSWYSLPNTLASPNVTASYPNDDPFNSVPSENVTVDDHGYPEGDSFKDRDAGEDRLKGNEFFNEDDVSKYQNFTNDCKTMGNLSFDWTEFFQTSLQGAGRKSPPPSPHPLSSSIAALSEVEFGLDFEPDSNMSEEACEIEFLEDDEPVAKISKRVRIQDIVRPESVASSWYIPSEHSGFGTPRSTDGDFKQSFGPSEVRTLNRASAAPTESNQLTGNKAHVCDEAKAAVTADAFNIDAKTWDGLHWIELMECGMLADNVDCPYQERFEVVAAVDHLEHVSAPTEFEAYFQPGHHFQTTDMTKYAPGRACPYKSLCCHFHDAAGRPVTLRRCQPGVFRIRCCHGSEASEPFSKEGLGDFIIRLCHPFGKAAASRNEISNEIKQSTEDALCILEDILSTTATQEAKPVHKISPTIEMVRAESRGLCEYATFVEDNFSNLDDAVDTLRAKVRQETDLARCRAVRKQKASAKEALSRLNSMFRTPRVEKEELLRSHTPCGFTLATETVFVGEKSESESSEMEPSEEEPSAQEMSAEATLGNKAVASAAFWTVDETIQAPEAELSRSRTVGERRLSAKDALLIFESILHRTAAQKADLTPFYPLHEIQTSEEEASSVCKGSTQAILAEHAKIVPSRTSFDYETTLADENTFWATAAQDAKLVRTDALQGGTIIAEEALPSVDESPRVTAAPKAESTLTTPLFYPSRTFAEDAFSMPDDSLRTTAVQDAIEDIVEALKLTEELEDNRSEVRNVSNLSFPPGFKFSIYGDILEEDTARSDEQNQPGDATCSETGSLTLEETESYEASNAYDAKSLTLEEKKSLGADKVCDNVNHSPTENVHSLQSATLGLMKDLNLRLVGKAASPQKRKVRALVDIFQSRNLMPEIPPILYCNSRMGTPPQQRFGRPTVQEAEQRSMLNAREFVYDWGKIRPGSAASIADTEASSRFGEVLERYGDVAYEDQENIDIAQ